tara:strand:+ start:5116 stop:5820 length:705 start_codon:yes stop_codon:yes gene_type:complete
MISKKILLNFEKKIGYKFKNTNLLSQSLTHPSFLTNNKKNNYKDDNFERLEFLGDRVLGLIISSLLYFKFNHLNEGDLSKRFSYLVQKKFLYKISKDLSLEKILLYDFKKNNTKMQMSIMSDSVESLIGSIFVDGGYQKSFNFVKKFWLSYLDIELLEILDPKTAIQELSQQKYKKLPEYKLLSKKGPPHSPIFKISLKVLTLDKIIETGSSIREAERKAALKALNHINENKTS